MKLLLSLVVLSLASISFASEFPTGTFRCKSATETSEVTVSETEIGGIKLPLLQFTMTSSKGLVTVIKGIGASKLIANGYKSLHLHAGPNWSPNIIFSPDDTVYGASCEKL